MNEPQTELTTISRRDFVRTAALAAGAVSSGIALTQARAADAPADATPTVKPAMTKPMIGFQAESSYLLQYGIARFFDDVQARANVNTLFLHCNLFEPSWIGIDQNSPSGNFATAHPQYYLDVYMKAQALGADNANLPDTMEQITAETKKRGIKIYPWMEEDNRAPPNIIGMDRLYEIDLYGRRTGGHPGGPCLNNPYFRNLISGQVEDFIRSYNVDGLQRGSERQGPLGNALGAWHHGSKSDPSHTSCFCEYCSAKAAKVGIDFDRVKKGFLALEPYVRAGRAGQRPRDGYFVEFWRLLLRYPELVAWENFWAESMREMQREFYTKAKSIRPEVQIGFHIWHNISFSPFYSAEQDYQNYTEYADFLKPALYDNPAAERMASFAFSVSQNVFGDLSPSQVLDLDYHFMNLQEKSYAEIIGPNSANYENQLRNLGINGTPRGTYPGFSGDYMYRETKRAVDGVAGSKTQICPGLGIDVAIKNSTPQSVHDAVVAIFKAGGTGMVLSTSHAAMRPENLSAAGDTLRELKLV